MLQSSATVTLAAVTIYTVFKLIGATGFVVFVSDTAALTNGGNYIFAPNAFSGDSNRGGASTGVNVTWNAAAVLATLSDTNDGTASNFMLRQDAGADTTTTASSGTMANPATVTIGAKVDGTVPLNMEFAALWIYTSAHSAGNKTSAHTTLAAEWGTP